MGALRASRGRAALGPGLGGPAPSPGGAPRPRARGRRAVRAGPRALLRRRAGAGTRGVWSRGGHRRPARRPATARAGHGGPRLRSRLPRRPRGRHRRGGARHGERAGARRPPAPGVDGRRPGPRVLRAGRVSTRHRAHTAGRRGAPQHARRPALPGGVAAAGGDCADLAGALPRPAGRVRAGPHRGPRGGADRRRRGRAAGAGVGLLHPRPHPSRARRVRGRRAVPEPRASALRRAPLPALPAARPLVTRRGQGPPGPARRGARHARARGG